MLTKLAASFTPANLMAPSTITTALIVLNVLAFAAFGVDKSLAINGQRRIREATLLKLAFFGGTPGAYAGRAAFRHKTRKQPFSTHLAVIAWLQMFAAAGAGWLLA